MQDGSYPSEKQLLAELLDRLAEARTFEDVNIAAGIALNDLGRTDD